MKELLVEDEGHPANLLNLRLRRRVPVDEVGGDGDGKLPPELLAPKTCGGGRELQEKKEVAVRNVRNQWARDTKAERLSAPCF